MIFNFDVMLCGGYANGSLKVEAKDLDEAYDKAIDMIGNKLADAFPELDIEYDVEETE